MLLPFLFTCLAYVNFNVAPVLPKEIITEAFEIAEGDFQDRWEVFEDGRKFTPFTPGRSDEEIMNEFEEIDKTRFRVWYRNPDSPIKEAAIGYEPSLSILFDEGARVKNCVAFAYNNLVQYYNASAMAFSRRYAIACEGTRAKDVHKFFTLLTQFQVTHLVRLTASHEGETKKCHPYWEGLTTQKSDGEWLLNVPFDEGIVYPINYFIEDEWLDDQGVDPKHLLDLVLKVKNSLDDQEDSLLAVHCSAGVGRTGTFLAALAIIDAIDNEEPFSIEEIVLRLSLQRVHSVARGVAYLALYRLAEEYSSLDFEAEDSVGMAANVGAGIPLVGG